jgi:hypothetical protein
LSWSDDVRFSGFCSFCLRFSFPSRMSDKSTKV